MTNEEKSRIMVEEVCILWVVHVPDFTSGEGNAALYCIEKLLKLCIFPRIRLTRSDPDSRS
jgi:hypothetical protein